MSLRVLLVEDFEPFRRFIHTTLQKAELQIIAEVSDGLEAVRKAEELQPDLILLDIGLPTLNGIEAARQIHLLSPQSKIIIREPRIIRRCSRGSSELWRTGFRH
jgi:DNA-binding NarL/FixJ family response regulator